MNWDEAKVLKFNFFDKIIATVCRTLWFIIWILRILKQEKFQLWSYFFLCWIFVLNEKNYQKYEKRWVPCHTKVEGSDIGEQLTGSDTYFIGPEPFFGYNNTNALLWPIINYTSVINFATNYMLKFQF
jgi:hypothetical protein